MIIDEKDFQIGYDAVTRTIAFTGSLRMSDPSQFDVIRRFLLEVYELDADRMVLDFSGLEFMNSAGISFLCKYIYTIKDLPVRKQVVVVGNPTLLWQRKSFENLPKVWDQVVVRFSPLP